ncbi:hypothetical protein Tco_0708786 [Tanacetum coccineum]
MREKRRDEKSVKRERARLEKVEIERIEGDSRERRTGVEIIPYQIFIKGRKSKKPDKTDHGFGKSTKNRIGNLYKFRPNKELKPRGESKMRGSKEEEEGARKKVDRERKRPEERKKTGEKTERDGVEDEGDEGGERGRREVCYREEERGKDVRWERDLTWRRESVEEMLTDERRGQGRRDERLEEEEMREREEDERGVERGFGVIGRWKSLGEVEVEKRERRKEKKGDSVNDRGELERECGDDGGPYPETDDGQRKVMRFLIGEGESWMRGLAARACERRERRGILGGGRMRRDERCRGVVDGVLIGMMREARDKTGRSGSEEERVMVTSPKSARCEISGLGL